jgi:hypothetical protein
MNDRLDFILRLFVVIVAMSSPFVCLLIEGELNSYSQYWNTDMRPLFIFTNAATSYFLFSVDRWKIPAICLMLLTAFSHDQYFWIHNITAICFFVTCLISISFSKKFQYYVLPYLASTIVLITSGIYWGEVMAISVICAYHLHRLIEYHKIESTRKKLRST